MAGAPRGLVVLGICAVLLAATVAHGEAASVVVGLAKCADCTRKNMKAEAAFKDLQVAIKCKNSNGEYQSKAAGKLDGTGAFSVPLATDLHGADCIAQLHNAANAPCPGQEPSKIEQLSEGTFVAVAGKTHFPSAECSSATICGPIKKKFLDHFHKKPVPPKPEPKPKPAPEYHYPTPTPTYGSPTPIYNPPVKPEPKPQPEPEHPFLDHFHKKEKHFFDHFHKKPVPPKPEPQPEPKPQPVPEYHYPTPTPSYGSPTPIYHPPVKSELKPQPEPEHPFLDHFHKKEKHFFDHFHKKPVPPKPEPQPEPKPQPAPEYHYPTPTPSYGSPTPIYHPPAKH